MPVAETLGVVEQYHRYCPNLPDNHLSLSILYRCGQRGIVRPPSDTHRSIGTQRDRQKSTVLDKARYR